MTANDASGRSTSPTTAKHWRSCSSSSRNWACTRRTWECRSSGTASCTAGPNSRSRRSSTPRSRTRSRGSPSWRRYTTRRTCAASAWRGRCSPNCRTSRCSTPASSPPCRPRRTPTRCRRSGTSAATVSTARRTRTCPSRPRWSWGARTPTSTRSCCTWATAPRPRRSQAARRWRRRWGSLRWRAS